METRTLAAGTIVHIQGIPVELKQDVDVWTFSSNWRLIEKLPSEIVGVVSQYEREQAGLREALNHLE